MLHPPRTFLTVAFPLACAVLLMACQTTSNTPGTSGASTTSTSRTLPNSSVEGEGKSADLVVNPGEEAALLNLEVEDFREILRQPEAKWLLVNVWATWCVACKDEFPDLLRLNEVYRQQGLRTVLLSADFEDEREDVLEFLKAQQVAFPSYIAQGEEHEFIEAMNPNWNGTLPATQIRNASGDVLFFKEGSVTFEELEAVLLGGGG